MALWTPANLVVPPKAWMRAAADQSVVLDHEGKIVAVPPHAGTIVSFSTTYGYRPSVGTLNGIRAVSIPTARVPLLIDDFNIARNIGAIAVFAVAKVGGLSVDWQNIVGFSTSGSVANRVGLFIRSNGLFEVGGRRLDADPYQYHKHSVMVGTSAAVLSGLFNYSGATLQAGVNGVYESRSGGFQAPGNTSDTTSFSAAIGASSITTDYYMENGLIGEVVVLQYLPTTDERQSIEGYLAHQWGLSGSLPSDHPYKSIAPSAGAGALRTISGFVKLDGDEAQARVLLLESETGELRAIAQSDPVSGYYTFEDVTGEVMAPGEDYFLLCDYGNGVRPLAHGPITPVVS